MSTYEDDVRKAAETAEHFRHGGPNDVLWLILQALRWIGGITFGMNGKLDALLARPQGGGMANIDEVLAAVAAIAGDTANVERVLGELNTQIGALTLQVADLQAQVAAGTGASPEQLQSGVDALNAADATLDTLTGDAPVP